MSDKKKYIDFNIDLGIISESNELLISDLFEFVSSVNIDCGFDIENAFSIKNAIQQCKFKNKVIGANIFLPKNIENPLKLTSDEIEAIVLYQLGAISAFADAEGMNIEYVRPCGKLYELMSENHEISLNVARAVKKFNKWLLLYCPAGKIAEQIANDVDINIVKEVDLSLAYKNDSSIDFEHKENFDNGAQLNRLRKLLNTGEIESLNKEFISLVFDSIHFDSNAENVIDLLENVCRIASPRPVNFNNAALSGWVD